MNYNLRDKHFIEIILIVVFVLLLVWYYMKNCKINENFAPYPPPEKNYNVFTNEDKKKLGNSDCLMCRCC